MGIEVGIEVTDEQIQRLRIEAAEAGDLAQIVMCDRALGSTDTADDYMPPEPHERAACAAALDMSADEARAACAAAISVDLARCVLGHLRDGARRCGGCVLD
jgi:hypothetical protein